MRERNERLRNSEISSRQLTNLHIKYNEQDIDVVNGKMVWEGNVYETFEDARKAIDENKNEKHEMVLPKKGNKD